MTYYLKYRPKNLKELDLTDVREKLTKILASKKAPHAYLFSGPKGLGKTSAARIFTKVINCQKRDVFLAKGKVGPCNKCSNCQQVESGRALDLIEIDAASNRGIDDIRNLKEKIKLMPSIFPFKVYVIDEVHMLTTEAFNALLKTLEEPPLHAIFILCTTNPEKVPPTIISRTLRLNFVHPSREEIKRSLDRVIKGESIKINSKAVSKIIDFADNSFRDAHKLLEQLSFEPGPIGLKEVEKTVGLTSSYNLQEFLKMLADGQVEESFQFLTEIASTGLNTRFFLKEILSDLRDKLLASFRLGSKSELFTRKDLRRLISLFSQAGQDKDNPIPFLPIQMAVMDFFSSDSSNSLDNMEPVTGSNQMVKPKRETGVKPKVKKVIPARKETKPPSPAKSKKRSYQGDMSIDELKDKWNKLISILQPRNHSIAALLRSSRPVAMDDDILTIEVYYIFHKSRLQTPKTENIILQALNELTGRDLKINFLLGSKKDNNNKDKQLIQVAQEIFEGG